MTTLAVGGSRDPGVGGMVWVLAFVVVMVMSLPVIFGSHAVKAHGQDAHDVRRCLLDSGPQMVYQKGDTFYLLCQIEDGRWGMQAVRRGAYDLYHELTSFVKGNGTLKELLSYMGRLGARVVTGLP